MTAAMSGPLGATPTPALPHKGGGSAPGAKLSGRGVWEPFGSAPGLSESGLGRPLTHDVVARAGLLPAVADVSLDIAPGEIFVIMGLSGSGKSTLVRCLSRLVEPSAGSILFDGRDLLSVSEREL